MTLAITHLDIGQPVPVVGHRPGAWREHFGLGYAHRQLAAASHHDLPFSADDVAYPNPFEGGHSFVTEDGLLSEELDSTALVVEIGERNLSVRPDRSHPPGDANGLRCFGSRSETIEALPQSGDRLPALVYVRKGRFHQSGSKLRSNTGGTQTSVRGGSKSSPPRQPASTTGATPPGETHRAPPPSSSV